MKEIMVENKRDNPINVNGVKRRQGEKFTTENTKEVQNLIRENYLDQVDVIKK